MLSRMRSVVIESGTWRWARWTSPRQEIVGNARPLALDEIFFYFCLTAAHFQALCHQKAISCDAQRGVMVKATASLGLRSGPGQSPVSSLGSRARCASASWPRTPTAPPCVRLDVASKNIFLEAQTPMKTNCSGAFVEQASVKLLSRGERTVQSVAQELNVNYHTARNWIKRGMANQAGVSYARGEPILKRPS